MKALFLIFFIFSLYISACTGKSNKVIVNEYNMENVPGYRNFIHYWKSFSVKFNLRDTAEISRISLDSIWVWGDQVSREEFIKRYNSGYSYADFPGILDTSKIKYDMLGCYPNPPIEGAIKSEYSEAFRCPKITIISDTIGHIVNGIEFSFIETSKGYRLMGINYNSYYWRMDKSVTDTMAIND